MTERTPEDELQREPDGPPAAPMRGGAEPVVHGADHPATKRPPRRRGKVARPPDVDDLEDGDTAGQRGAVAQPPEVNDPEAERLRDELDALAQRLAESLESRAAADERLAEELEGRAGLERVLAHQVDARAAAEKRAAEAEQTLAAVEARLAAIQDARVREAQAGGVQGARPPRTVGVGPTSRPTAPPPGSLPAEWMVAAALMAVGVVVVLLVLSGALGAIF